MTRTGWIMAALALALGGCSAIPDSADEIVTVDAAPRPPSTHCVVSNSLSSWPVFYLPANVSILRDSKPLLVTCRAAGFHGELYVRAHRDFAAAFLGTGSDVVAEGSDATPPAAPYQGNTSNKANGLISTYPGLLLVPMRPDGR